MTEFRPGRFQILPTVIKNLIIINVLVYLAQILPGRTGTIIENNFALHTWQSPLFKPWQFLTYMFLHDPGNWLHIIFNMFGLWMFGSVLENLWGTKRFLTFYIICGLGAAFCHMVVLYYENQQLLNSFNFLSFEEQNSYRDALEQRINEATLGASGAVFGCLTAFGYLFPNTYLYLFFAIPIKAKWVIIFYIVSELVSTVKSSAGDNVAHVAHLGGALVGFLMVYFWNKNNRQTFY